MAQMKKNPVSGKTVKTTTFNLLTPFKKTKKVINERTTRKPVAKTTVKPKPATKAPAKMPAMPKTKTVGNRKKVLIMPDKISPSKMTPAQKAKYLQNPERYDK